MSKELEDFVDYMRNGEEPYISPKSVSVIIPFFNNWHLTHQRMSELYSEISTPLEIILVDDCSTDESIPGKMGWWRTQSKHRVKCIKTPKNLGFGGAMNHGARRGVATEEVLVFLSNDVKIAGDFVPLILQKLRDNENILIGDTFRNYDTGWNVMNINGKPKMFPYLEGYFLSCTKEMWIELGGFDPIFAPYDVEDIDLSTTALHKGYGLVPLNFRRLQHASGQTIRRINPDREAITKRNLKRFVKKWSEILKDE